MARVITILTLVFARLWVPVASPADGGEGAAVVRKHADQAFERLHPTTGNPPAGTGVSREEVRSLPRDATPYAPDSYLIGTGHGDLAKGRVTCQRVAELSARTDLAKQIRVLVKEHTIDRLRERTGHNSEQEIEIVREEIVQEYLQGVKIIDRRFDEAGNTCSATAVMPKEAISPIPPREMSEPAPVSAR